jgi:uncharacterized membrane protein YjgN (DUF898 family)
MIHSPTNKSGEVHALKFHGKASSFFIICLINGFLSLITLGIFLPWALVRCRRYIYENMELHGTRFGYHAKGRDIFISWFAITVIISILGFIESLSDHAGEMASTPWVLILAMPCMMVKSLSYHATMTTLNNVRFWFQCSMLRAWCVLVGIPLVTLVVFSIVFIGYSNLMGPPSGVNSLIARVICGVVVGMVVFCAINGIIYRHWITLLANNFKFGIHSFDVNIKTSKCVIISLISMAILIPFMIVIIKMFMSLMDQYGLFGLLSGHTGAFALSYLLYFIAIVLSSAYAFSALRNYTFNNLMLAKSIRFHSSLTFVGTALNLLLLFVVSSLTLGLAYPWAKIRLLRYQVEHTTVIGDLDELDLTNDDQPLDMGIFARISRGTATALPFM